VAGTVRAPCTSSLRHSSVIRTDASSDTCAIVHTWGSSTASATFGLEESMHLIGSRDEPAARCQIHFCVAVSSTRGAQPRFLTAKQLPCTALHRFSVQNNDGENEEKTHMVISFD
jgi:hypothetical protein